MAIWDSWSYAQNISEYDASRSITISQATGRKRVRRFRDRLDIEEPIKVMQGLEMSKLDPDREGRIEAHRVRVVLHYAYEPRLVPKVGRKGK